MSEAEILPSTGYMLLSTDSMQNNENWGTYIQRLQGHLPEWIVITSGRYVTNVKGEDELGARFEQGVFHHSDNQSGHLFNLLII